MESVAAVEATPKSIRVVLVDDHSMVAESFMRALSRFGDIDVVAIAGTGEDAITAAARLEPDVVVMDYNLPDIDGVTAAGRITATVGSRVLLLSGSAPEGVLQAALAVGCVGYLQKTAGVEKLATAIRNAAAGGFVLAADDLKRLLFDRGRSAPRPSTLTPRELEILALLGEGLSNRAIATRLVLSVNTVRTHVQTVLTKLGAHSKLEAVVIATKSGLLNRR